jgi:hypothetical protein
MGPPSTFNSNVTGRFKEMAIQVLPQVLFYCNRFRIRCARPSSTDTAQGKCLKEEIDGLEQGQPPGIYGEVFGCLGYY